ncbi:unnamed protein product [Caenorhabditis nigoni]
MSSMPSTSNASSSSGIQSHRESQEGMHSVEQFQQTTENTQEYAQAAHRRIPTETERNVNAQMQQHQKLQPNANAPHQLNNYNSGGHSKKLFHTVQSTSLLPSLKNNKTSRRLTKIIGTRRRMTFVRSDQSTRIRELASYFLLWKT